MEIGAQLYTLKTYCQNEKDLARSLAKVAGMGYSCVQLSAIGPIAPERIKAICDDNGLKIVLTHTPEAEVHGRPEETIEKHRLFGCRYIGIGSLPERYRNPDFLPYFAEDFLLAGFQLFQNIFRERTARTAEIFQGFLPIDPIQSCLQSGPLLCMEC